MVVEFQLRCSDLASLQLPPMNIDVQKRRKLSISSHSPMGEWDIPRDVHLSLYRCVCVQLSIPWSHGTVGIVHRIPRSHGTVGHSMGCPPVPLQMCVCPTVHPMVPWDSGIVHRIPRSHGTVGHSMGCPHVPLTDTPTVHSIPLSHESIVTVSHVKI